MAGCDNLLVLVLDTNPLVWAARGGFSECVDSVLVAAKAHLMMDPSHSVALIACSGGHSQLVYPTGAGAGAGQQEQFAVLEAEVVARLHQQPPGAADAHTALAGALGQALCYIQRVTRDLPVARELHAKILVVYASPDHAAQYMPTMNAIFAAAKQSVPIDACVVSTRSSGLLQQACEITGGLYAHIKRYDGLLEYLLTLFVVDKDARSVLQLPAQAEVDYRAACFCHNNIISLGMVCSVCLSVFCGVRGVCSTCHTRFKPRMRKT